MADVVLVTGVSRYLGGRFARAVSERPDVSRVIGVDVIPPPHDIGRAKFMRADIRNPVIGRVIAREDVDTVVHMSVIATPTSAGGRVSMKEINVIGTMQLLAACQRSPSVQRVVVKSTAGVYGSSPHDPAMFTEDMGPKGEPRAGWARDSVEVEGYVRGFSRRRPDVDVVVLRLANVVGPGMHTGLTDYLALPVVPVVAGHDPRFQLLHEDDAVGAMLAGMDVVTGGTTNVAAEGVLTVSQAAHLAGRVTVPVPGPLVAGASRALCRRARVDFAVEERAFLSYGRGLDTIRMRDSLRLKPRFTTRGAVEDHVRARGLHGPLSRDVVTTVERRLVGALGRLDHPRRAA